MSVTLPTVRRAWRPAVLAGLLALGAPLGALAQNALWTNTTDLPASAQRYTAQLTAYRAIDVDMAAMRAALLPAPAEAQARTSTVIVALPTPDGGTERFRVSQVTVMHPDLAAKYPSIKTYQGYGIENPTAIARLDVSPAGFHAMVLGLKSRYFIDPAVRFGDDVHHLVFSRSAMKSQPFVCERDPQSVATPSTPTTGIPGLALRQSNGTLLKTYRLALANSYEYAAAVGNTQIAVAAAKVTSMNRVNGVYERELSCRMVLVANNNLLDFVRGISPAPSPVYTDAVGSTMLGQNQTNVDRVIGPNNYDIGHVFSTGGGGIAQKPSLCVSGSKARGVTGSPQPVGDAFDIDFVAHEMGHQFNCDHTFNAGNAGNCTEPGTRASNAAYEPGSGVTIMAYAGICAPEDLDPHSIDTFHSYSFDQVLSHINGAGNCGVVTNTNNTAPIPNASGSYTIPARTPFSLTGSATDAESDPLTYEWEEFDRNTAFTAINAPTGNQPIFRPFLPSTSPTRYFPQLSDIQSNTQTFGEMLPTYSRVMNFRLVARDNRGGVNYAANTVTVVGTAGPLLVTLPNTSNIIWQAGAPAQVTWDVAGTAAAPISAANVDILLSTDGGNTYPITLLTNTPNDGSQGITVPAGTPGTTTARVMVRASGNIFFDISNQNFTIEASNGPTFYINPATTTTPLGACANANATATVNVGQIAGFTGSVTLGSANLPTGVTVSFAPAAVAAGASTTATVSVAPTATAGTYQLQLSGVSGGVTHSQLLAFTVLPTATQAAVGITPNTPTVAIQRPRFTWNAVPNATTYHLQVSTSNTFATTVIDQTVTGTSFVPTAQLAANTTYYWRVQGTNACGTAPYSAVLTFQTGTQTCNTVAAPASQVTRATMAGGTLTSNITITDGARVGEVRVRNLVINHSSVADLEVTLTNPAGNSVIIIARNACATGTGYSLNLDDLATAALSCPANTGATVRPSNPLIGLSGANANGTWSLRINDAGSGTGTLVSWSLEICTLGEAPARPTNIVALFNGFNASTGLGNNEVFWTPATGGSAATYYELQRAFTTNVTWTGIGGNLPVASGPLYEDYVGVSGRYYYRVRSCNVYGCSEWTNEASVLGSRASAQQVGVTVAPNPSTGLFQIGIDNAQHGAVALRVTDALGRTVAQEQLTKGSAALQHTLDLSRLAPGVYHLHLALPDGTVVQKLLKQ